MIRAGKRLDSNVHLAPSFDSQSDDFSSAQLCFPCLFQQWLHSLAGPATAALLPLDVFFLSSATVARSSALRFRFGRLLLGFAGEAQ